MAEILRIINLSEGQRNDIQLADGRRVSWCVRRFRGKLRLEVDTMPAGARITSKTLTARNKVK